MGASRVGPQEASVGEEPSEHSRVRQDPRAASEGGEGSQGAAQEEVSLAPREQSLIVGRLKRKLTHHPFLLVFVSFSEENIYAKKSRKKKKKKKKYSALI